VTIKIHSSCGRIGTSDYDGKFHGSEWWGAIEKEISLPDLVEGLAKGEIIKRSEDGKFWGKLKK
jgi:hypothetical protein